MTRLKNLYTHLMTNRPQETSGWLKEYQRLTADVEKIRAALDSGSRLQDPQTYAGTSVEEKTSPFESFAREFIYNKYNGVSSRGQSILGDENFRRFIADAGFVAAMEALIRTPNAETLRKLREAWASFEVGQRPLLVNRMISACTTELSTTVDEGKFNAVYWWLRTEGLIDRPAEPADDWYSRNRHLLSELRAHFREELEAEQTSEHALSIFVWQLYMHMAEPFTLNRQVVRYGPPGTGKTHAAMQHARLRFAMWKAEFNPSSPRIAEEHIHTVQFHPSYSYEDFMEGLRPAVVSGQPQLRLQNGIFKELCRQAGRWELDVWLHASPELALRWQTLTIDDLLPWKDSLPQAAWSAVFQNAPEKRVADAVPPFFLIIDEINRAELSRVFGELMLCLEHRGVRGAVQTQYALLNDASTGMLPVNGGFRFFVPHNVYLIGSMNTIDRSVESFDFALRRRFRWEKVMPDFDVLRHHLRETDCEHWSPLVDELWQLNEAIKAEPLLGEDYQIGHAYLMNLPYSAQMTHPQVRAAAWHDSLAPLIEEYLRGSFESSERQERMRKFENAFGVR